MKQILLLFLSVNLIGQCPDYINLRTQTQVDSFIANFGNCTSVDSLKIDLTCETDRIRNLDSLVNIERTGSLFLGKIGGASCTLESIDGLRNLKYVRRFQIEALDSLKHVSEFSSLDSIVSLRFTADKREVDLSVFRNVKFMDVLTCSGNITFAGLTLEAKQSINTLIVGDNEIGGEIDSLIMQDSVHRIVVRYSNNIIFNSSQKMKKLHNLSLTKNTNTQFANVENVEFDYLALNYPGFTSFSTPFSNVNELEVLFLVGIPQLSDFYAAFPNLSQINSGLVFAQNENLESIEHPLMKGIPNIDNPYYFNRYALHIEDNPKLKLCNEWYVCETLALFPGTDKVFIENNDTSCILDSIIEYCQTLSTNQFLDASTIRIFPNPTHDNMSIRGLPATAIIQIYNCLGQLETLQQMSTENGEISINHLVQGSYFLRILDKAGKPVFSELISKL